MIFPIDNRGLGGHRDIIQQMSSGTSKDRQLLEVLDEVITRNNEELNGKEQSEHADDDDLEHGNNEELNGKEESEHADDDDLEDENKTKNELVDKSHSLDLESQQESHSETDGYGNSNEDTSKQQVQVHDGVTSQEMIETDSVDHDICTQKRDGGNNKESDSVDQSDGPGNLIVIEPLQAKQEAEKDSINSDSVNTESTAKHYVYNVKTGMAYDINDLDLSSFNELFLIDPYPTPTGVQHRVTKVQLATGTAIATPDTPPQDTTTTTTEKLSLTHALDNSCVVVGTPEKPAAPTTDNIPSPHTGEVHVLKMIVQDVEDGVKVKKEPCSEDDNKIEHDRQLEKTNNEECDGEEQVSSESEAKTNNKKHDVQHNEDTNGKSDVQLEKNDNEKHDGEGQHDSDKEKEKQDSDVNDADKQASEEKKVGVDDDQVSVQSYGEEDPLI